MKHHNPEIQPGKYQNANIEILRRRRGVVRAAAEGGFGVTEQRCGTCDNCHKRHGDVVIDEVRGPFVSTAGNKIEAFRFTYRLCRWCKGVETKRRNDFKRRNGG